MKSLTLSALAMAALTMGGTQIPAEAAPRGLPQVAHVPGPRYHYRPDWLGAGRVQGPGRQNFPCCSGKHGPKAGGH